MSYFGPSHWVIFAIIVLLVWRAFGAASPRGERPPHTK